MANNTKLEEDLNALFSYQKVARDYGLYFKKVSVARPGDAPREFLVFSINPIGDDVNPVAIINRNHRNTNIFYPDSYAIELPCENPLLMWEGIVGYVAYAEFMCHVYEEFNKPIPKAIRVDELTALLNFYRQANNPDFDAATRRDYMNGVKDFFKNENLKPGFKRDWQEFYRSELYDGDASFRKNRAAFKKRNEPETSMEILLKSSGTLNQLEMPEHHYKEFREIIKVKYPGVKYYAGEKTIVDKGIITDPKTGERVWTQYGLTVTKEEYDKIKEERFAIDGHACLDGLNVSYFETRNLIYKPSDENIIASVAHSITYRWAKCATLEYLEQYGPLISADVPPAYMLNFYAEMQGMGVPFYIDFDVNSRPNFNVVRIVYNDRYRDRVRNLLIGLTKANVDLSHLSMENKNIMYDINDKEIGKLVRQAKERKRLYPNDDDEI